MRVYHGRMYLDAMEFLEEERDAWAPYEALADLSDEQPAEPQDEGPGRMVRPRRDGSLLAWQEIALRVAKELAVNETSQALAQESAKIGKPAAWMPSMWTSRATWVAVPMAELRDRFATQPGELRGYLTVVPETRWLKHARNLESFRDETVEHYEEHADHLRAILSAAAAG